MHSLRSSAFRAASTASRSLLSTSRNVQPFTARLALTTPKPNAAYLFQRRFISQDVTKDESVTNEKELSEDATPSTSFTTRAPPSNKPQADTWPGHQISPEEVETYVYAGNIPFEVTEKSLEEQFARHGPVKRLKIVKDGEGRSKGFCFVQFESKVDAQKAVFAMNQVVLEGRRLAVQLHQPKYSKRPVREPGAPSDTLYIGNMPYNVTDEDLNQVFRKLTNVTDVRVAIDRRTGQPRGFAHADFTDIESATAAKAALEGMQLRGRPFVVDFTKSSVRRTPYKSNNEQEDS